MPQQPPSIQVHGEFLLQFPGFPLILYQMWLRGGLTEAFDEKHFFRRLIESGAYQHQRLNHSYKEEHGPFAVSRIRPDHYERTSFEEAEKALHERLIPASPAEMERNLDPWPSPALLERRLTDLLSYVHSPRLRWYRLAISLDEAQYWSEGYREVPILDHFGEWVGVDPEESMVYMLQVIQD